MLLELGMRKKKGIYNFYAQYCYKTCIADPKCQYVTFWSNSTCVRYCYNPGVPCTLVGNTTIGGDLTYKKVGIVNDANDVFTK